MGSGASTKQAVKTKPITFRMLQPAEFKQYSTLILQALNSLAWKINVSQFPFPKCYVLSYHINKSLVLKQGVVSDKVYVVLKGQCLKMHKDPGGSEYNHTMTIVGMVLEGASFGVVGAAYCKESCYSVLAFEETEILTIPKDLFTQFEIVLNEDEFILNKKDIFMSRDKEMSKLVLNKTTAKCLNKSWVFINRPKDYVIDIAQKITQKDFWLLPKNCNFISTDMNNSDQSLYYLINGQFEITDNVATALVDITEEISPFLIDLGDILLPLSSSHISVITKSVCYVLVIPKHLLQNGEDKDFSLDAPWKGKSELLLESLKSISLSKFSSNTTVTGSDFEIPSLDIILAAALNSSFLRKKDLDSNKMLEIILNSKYKKYKEREEIDVNLKNDIALVIHGSIEQQMMECKGGISVIFGQSDVIERAESKAALYTNILSCQSSCCGIILIPKMLLDSESNFQ